MAFCAAPRGVNTFFAEVEFKIVRSNRLIRHNVVAESANNVPAGATNRLSGSCFELSRRPVSK